MMRFAIFLTCLALLTSNGAHAQRIYAPAMDSTALKEDSNIQETLIYILKPEYIDEVLTTEKQIHIQLNRNAREYFYTLTSLNVGKTLIIKSAVGETIQTAIIPRAIDSGIIISSPIEQRGEMLSFAQRIKQGRARQIFDSSGFISAPLVKEPEAPKAVDNFESDAEMDAFKEDLNQQ